MKLATKWMNMDTSQTLKLSLMKNSLIFILMLSSIFSFHSILNAVWNEETNTEIQQYNPKDYDPWIPLDWIREDWTFWE